MDYVLALQQDNAQEPKKAARERLAALRDPSTRARQPIRHLPLDEIFSFFKDITSGLAHLHANGYVHRDLKPQNCLLHKTGDSVKVLVSDFGEMQGATVPRAAHATGYTGTISFAAPEILRRQENGLLGDFTVKSDVFSLGMIVFFMCFGRLPYSSANLEDDHKEDIDGLKDEVMSWHGLRNDGKERSDIPERLYENLQLLLSEVPDERPTTDEILRRIRLGSSFSDHTSPVKERFSSEAEFRKERSKSPEGPETIRVKDLAPPQRRTSSSYGSRGVVKRANSGIAPIHQSNETASRTPPMLMAPPETGVLQRMKILCSDPNIRYNIVMVVQGFCFLLKLWTLTSPCFPHAPKANIFYPLVMLAASNLTQYSRGPKASLFNAVWHVVVLYRASRTGELCQA